MKRVGIIFAMQEELEAFKEYLKIEKEYSEHPKFEDYTRLQAINFCSRFVTFGRGKALKFQQVKDFVEKFNINWQEIVEFKSNLQSEN